MRTSAATSARMDHYDAVVRQAIPQIRVARSLGARCADQFATFLNNHSVPAPSGACWSKSTVLRVLRRAKRLGIDKGSYPPSACKIRHGRGNPGKVSEAFLAKGLS